MRIMGIDYGEKRFGIALSDPLGITAQGLPTIERTSIQEDIKKIINILQEKEVEEIVLGLPKHLNNTLGDKAKEVLNFIDTLKKHINIPIKTFDERFSTVRANRAMLEGDLSRKKRKERVDMIAAQLILQGYLDMIKTKTS
ncbi:MAG: Holliday junction DNA helicase RuvA [Planctomycetes bacterium RIFCSPHIGHO2_12_39_6]|nr:MAG: Holliday junction DNA helicase RuvA [Planctomycetes bacterium RIFCSPHIGHO2_12_39_6]